MRFRNNSNSIIFQNSKYLILFLASLSISKEISLPTITFPSGITKDNFPGPHPLSKTSPFLSTINFFFQFLQLIVPASVSISLYSQTEFFCALNSFSNFFLSSLEIKLGISLINRNLCFFRQIYPLLSVFKRLPQIVHCKIFSSFIYLNPNLII